MSEGSYKDARGAAPNTSGMSPEEAIRRTRGDYSDEIDALTEECVALRARLLVDGECLLELCSRIKEPWNQTRSEYRVTLASIENSARRQALAGQKEGDHE